MKRVFGIICMLLGAVLLAGAVALAVYNQQEETAAVQATEEYLPKVLEVINKKISDTSDTSESASDAVETTEGVPEDVHSLNNSYVSNMLVVNIDGYDFVGYISIPKLGLELPVMSETDMELMRIAPCRFSGSPKTENLVVGAHNYKTHFGNIEELSEGDTVIFTDMEGNVRNYSVSYTELLLETDVLELQNSGFPLTIYTCTYDGESRVTVRCVNQ